jgi:hypothetical protein
MHAPSFLARQLAHPSGFFGRQVISRFMNRSTAGHNAMVLEDLEVGPASRVLEVGFGGAARQARDSAISWRCAWGRSVG